MKAAYTAEALTNGMTILVDGEPRTTERVTQSGGWTFIDFASGSPKSLSLKWGTPVSVLISEKGDFEKVVREMLAF